MNQNKFHKKPSDFGLIYKVSVLAGYFYYPHYKVRVLIGDKDLIKLSISY